MPTKSKPAATVGSTRAMIEQVGDKRALEQFSAAEARTGMPTGVRFRPDGTPCLVTLLLYPKTSTMVCDLDPRTMQPHGEARRIESAEYATLKPLRL